MEQAAFILGCISFGLTVLFILFFLQPIIYKYTMQRILLSKKCRINQNIICVSKRLSVQFTRHENGELELELISEKSDYAKGVQQALQLWKEQVYGDISIQSKDESQQTVETINKNKPIKIQSTNLDKKKNRFPTITVRNNGVNGHMHYEKMIMNNLSKYQKNDIKKIKILIDYKVKEALKQDSQ